VRLLLVEDDAMIAEAIRTGLKRDGFAVDWVQDGESADQVLRTDDFDPVRAGSRSCRVCERGSKHFPFSSSRHGMPCRIACKGSMPERTTIW
jgi:CheY-like chemotaxis protein